MTSLEVIFQSLGEEKVTGAQIRWIRGQRSYMNVFTDQEILWQGSLSRHNTYFFLLLFLHIWHIYIEVSQEPLCESVDWPFGPEAETLCRRFHNHPKDGQHTFVQRTFDLIILVFFWPWRSWSVSFHALVLGFRVILRHLRLVIGNDTKWVSYSIDSKKSKLFSHLMSFSSCEKFCETILGRFFLSSIHWSKSVERWCESNSTHLR